MGDFKSDITQLALDFEKIFTASLPKINGLQSRVIQAMHYAALGGGKRLRPYFLIKTAEMVCGSDGVCKDEKQGVWLAACALEAVHVYSLIHDDLPCMDDDDLRRGKPTVHRAFDEATAVLAGDALLSFAFELMASDHIHPDPQLRLKLVSELAKASGYLGMVGGQMIDLTMADHPDNIETISQMQNLKTGALIHYAIMAGARLGGANGTEKAALSAYARHIGLLFQITDDLLDVEGDSKVVGKAVGKDDAGGKATFVSILGVEGAKAQAADMALQAKQALAPFGHKASPLQNAIDFVLYRDR